MIRQSLIGAVFCGIAAMAAAHSMTDKTVPANGAILNAVPGEIKLQFNDAIRLTKVEMTHAETHREAMDLSGYTSFDTEFVFPITGMGAGRYDVEWRGLGKDGHPMTGTFVFEVK